ncbi:hypothetical protein ACR79K_22525 [Sphingobacterium siyangense]|uniref:hypothetical protein n=1 Tax=Sphingobacterium siyangense TaxID=459529 RepID=UPI003DA4B6B0
MFKNFFKTEKPQVKEEPAVDKSFKINDYYGRFTLEEIDAEVDVMRLQKLQEEVRLDYKNNQATFEQNGNIKTRKHMNFCRFMLSRIEQRISEIRKVQSLSRDLIKYKRASPDKWKLIVSIIVERYPGVDLQHIEQIIEKGE